jgi:hypothetical protein
LSKKEKVTETLKGLPPDLYSYYGRLIEKVPEQDKADLAVLLQILRAANTPLSKDEICLVFALKKQAPKSTAIPQTAPWPFATESCANLVSIDRKGTVGLIHRSLDEYILSRSERWQKTLDLLAALAFPIIGLVIFEWFPFLFHWVTKIVPLFDRVMELLMLVLFTTRFIISSNDRLQICLLFVWSRHIIVKTIFGKGKNLYVAIECNNQRY